MGIHKMAHSVKEPTLSSVLAMAFGKAIIPDFSSAQFDATDK